MTPYNVIHNVYIYKTKRYSPYSAVYSCMWWSTTNSWQNNKRRATYIYMHMFMISLTVAIYHLQSIHQLLLLQSTNPQPAPPPMFKKSLLLFFHAMHYFFFVLHCQAQHRPAHISSTTPNSPSTNTFRLQSIRPPIFFLLSFFCAALHLIFFPPLSLSVTSPPPTPLLSFFFIFPI